jgi:large conductance mechanosensitive channel
MLKEFKEFIKKGNVVEMAVGLIMAVHFGAIVKSFVDDIIMPPIGMLLGGVDFSDLKFIIREAVPAQMSGDVVVVAEIQEVAIRYGSFINLVITFLIVAWAVFMVVKGYNRLKKKEAAPAPPPPPPEPSKEEVLLTEIRDLLKKQ